MKALGRREVEDVSLNLIPIMNLFTALIPFLLLSAAFYHLAIIKVSVPVASRTGETDVAKEANEITLNLRITSQAFELSAASDILEPEKLKELSAKVERKGGEDKAAFAELAERAYKIKSSYPASSTVVVLPDEDVTLSIVVAALDAVRTTTRTVAGQVANVELFPRVVLSSLVK